MSSRGGVTSEVGLSLSKGFPGNASVCCGEKPGGWDCENPGGEPSLPRYGLRLGIFRVECLS